MHVLVHRESEEYQTDLEDGNSPDGKGKRHRVAKLQTAAIARTDKPLHRRTKKKNTMTELQTKQLAAQLACIPTGSDVCLDVVKI